MCVAKKILFVVLDGAADRPTVAATTPLKAATTPFFDRLAQDGILGIMDVIGPGTPPGSDTAHLSLLGLSLIHISEPTRLLSISYAVFCLKPTRLLSIS